MSHETPEYVMRFARAISPDYPELVLSRDERGILTLATQRISALEAELDDLRTNAGLQEAREIIELFVAEYAERYGIDGAYDDPMERGRAFLARLEGEKNNG